VDTVGWSFLDVSSSDSFASGQYTNADLAYGAGLVEGYLTQRRIYQAWTNYGGNVTLPDSVTQFLAEQAAWVATMTDKYAATEPYWEQGALLLCGALLCSPALLCSFSLLCSPLLCAALR
jgi:hypothetical protein